MREVLKVPHPALRKKSRPVAEITPGVLKLAEDLREVLSVEHEGIIYVSVSAPQLGKHVRLFVYRDNPYSGVPSTVTVINPEFVYRKNEITVKEQCVSIPGKQFYVRRHSRVKVRGMGLDGNTHTYKGTGVVAQVLQHETDHLDGVLIDEIGSEIVT